MSFLCTKYNVDKEKAPIQKVPSSFDQFLTVFKVTEFLHVTFILAENVLNLNCCICTVCIHFQEKM